MALDNDEIQRYSRHLLLPGFSKAHQERLKNSTVLLVGAGGLGCPILQYLVSAGVGRVKIVDHDVVSMSNLQRQVLYREEDIGKNKAQAACKRLKNLNSRSMLLPFPYSITKDNAFDLVDSVDVIVDATDNFPSRYLLSDLGELADLPVVFGAVHQYEGQITVFNYKGPDLEIRSPSYRDIYPHPPVSGLVPDCSQAGVIGVLPGLIGVMQANEVIKVICGHGEVLASRLLIYDSLSARTRFISYRKNTAREKVSELIDYEVFCGNINRETRVKEISSEALILSLERGETKLIDIRELSERKLVHIGGEHILVSELNDFLQKENGRHSLVLYCKSGKRSFDAVIKVQELFPKLDFLSLKGGLLAYIDCHNLDLPHY